MDVRCERCQARYVVDDGLVDEAGLAVRCSKCGHLFRVSRHPRGWSLRRAGGPEVAVGDTAAVQRWIVEGKAQRDDEVSRDGGAWVRFGTLKEFEPFFAVVERAQRAPASGELRAVPDDEPTLDLVDRGPDVWEGPGKGPTPSAEPVWAAAATPGARAPHPSSAGPARAAQRQPPPARARRRGSLLPWAVVAVAVIAAAGAAVYFENPGWFGMDHSPSGAPANGTAGQPTGTASSAGAGSAATTPTPPAPVASAPQPPPPPPESPPPSPPAAGPPGAPPPGAGAPMPTSPTAERVAPPPPVETPPSPGAALAGAPAQVAAQVAAQPAPAATPPPGSLGQPGPTAAPPEPHPAAAPLPPQAPPAPPSRRPTVAEVAPPERSAPPAGAPPTRREASQARTVRTLLADARRLRDRGRSEQALDAYARAVQLEPANADALAGRGLCYLDLSQYVPAEDSFKAALAASADNPAALMGLAETYRYEGRRAEALTYYRKYLAVHPEGEDATAARNAISALEESP